MSIASSHILDWTPPDAQQFVEPSGTLAIPVEDRPHIVVSPDARDYVTLIQEHNRECEPAGETLLREVVDGIRALAPLEVDGETQKLLDAAIEYQETGACDDVKGWASRLAADVKDADD